MTNRDMVKPPREGMTSGMPEPKPNATALPPMPAPEDSTTPTTDREPIDSPQLNASAERDPPGPGQIGLSTNRKG